MTRISITLFALAAVLCSLPASAQRGIALSPDQKAKLHKLATEMKSEVYPVRRAMMEKRQALVGLYGQYNLNEKKARETTKDINSLQRKMLELNHSNQVRLRKALDKQDFELFAKAMARGPGGPQRHSGPGGGSDDGIDTFVPGDVDKRGIDGLKLAPNQVERVKRQLSPSDAGRAAAFKKLREDTEAIRNLYLKYDLDEKRARELLNSINASQRRMLENSLERQIELRKVLSEEQFNTLMQNVRRGMQHRRGTGPRNR